MRRARGMLVVLAAALVASACGGGDGTTTGGGGQNKPSGCPRGANLPAKVCKGEGALNLIAWAGYAEDGSNDPAYDWVTPFEKQTGCQVEVTYGDTSDQMVTLMRQGGGKQFDGVSASGDASNRLIAGGDVAPINVNLIPDFKDVSPALQSPPHNTVKDVHYGVSYMWGANLLAFDTKVVKPAPTSWDVVFDPNTPYKKKLTAYDSPIYIADAALYLKAHRPELGIQDPYELTEAQLDASVDLLKGMDPNIKKYWALFSDEIDLFASGDVVAGTAWPYQVNALQTDKHPVEGIIPEEGATGWADTWMMSSNAQHPNCMYLWMRWATKPDVQKQVAEWFGASPANAATCDLLGKEFCDAYHVTDQSYFDNIAFWKTPLADCGNGKTDCTDYSVWTQKWTEIRGA